MAHTPLECLGLPRVEVFETPRTPRFGREYDIDFAEDGVVLFGSVELPVGDLEKVTFDGYGRLLALIHQLEYRHPLRLWATVPSINENVDNLERYRSFCLGRGRALEAHHGSGFAQRLCASSAVGSAAGPPSLYFLASKEPGCHHENPRQVAAYAYPLEYGPRSPSFARATVAPEGLGHSLYIAGTASIVGHETRHRGDLGGQLAETLINLETLIEALRPEPINSTPDFVKVYVRHADDLALVQKALASTRWSANQPLFLRADICRSELLVEIEAVT